jgi:hypothetical protein
VLFPPSLARRGAHGPSRRMANPKKLHFDRHSVLFPPTVGGSFSCTRIVYDVNGNNRSMLFFCMKKKSFTHLFVSVKRGPRTSTSTCAPAVMFPSSLSLSLALSLALSCILSGNSLHGTRACIKPLSPSCLLGRRRVVVISVLLVHRFCPPIKIAPYAKLRG